ncbi:MAG TPA: polysaccharide deacetylase family protein [Candidatus Nanoarchaeia archaeon]|nr:polysaccharide deacetylase family protein [Candidatus Nanoarchaeia archaeon]
MEVAITFDVEPDLHSGNFKSIIEGIPKIMGILEKYNVKGTFFTTSDCIEKNPEVFRELIRRGHEIASHGHRHARFDELTFEETELSLINSKKTFKKYLNQQPKGFRAPQLSIDKKTLYLLKKHKFTYDSSFAPLDLMLLFFLPSKFKQWLWHFFSNKKVYEIKKDLYEIPTSAIIIPFVSLVFRVLNPQMIKTYSELVKIFNKQLVIYFHSWDFIDVPESKIDRLWSKEKLIYNLDKFLEYSTKKYEFKKLYEMVKKDGTKKYA